MEHLRTALWPLAKAELMRANADRKHPFRYFTLGTLGETYPELRTVVNRGISAELILRCYTDSRTPKVAQLRQHSEVSALFYHPKKQLQVRIKGQARLVESGEAFEQIKSRLAAGPSARDYQTQRPPGSAWQEDALGEHLYFCLVEIIPDEIDLLQLRREGHLRSSLRRHEDGWEEIPLVP
ncbi:MAG: pyridoxamine 5'-phosphate oxidase family protein [Bacteroidota bacterium]